MTSIVNFITSRFISSSGYGAISNGIGLLVIGIMLTLLIERVLVDAYSGKPDEKRGLAFTVTILPLLFMMLIVIGLRVAQVLHL
jgi:hypothetical protein